MIRLHSKNQPSTNSRKETVSSNPFFQPKKSFKSLFASLVIILAVFVVGIGSVFGQAAATGVGNIISANATITDRGGAGNYANSTNEWITIAGRPGVSISIS